jgi:hypothetical protein
MRGILWRIAGSVIAVTVADGGGVGGAAIAGAVAVGWFAASCGGGMCAEAMTRRRRRSATWVSEMARRSGTLTGTGDGTLRGEPLLVFAARGWTDPRNDIYDRNGRRIATGQPRRESAPVLTGPLGARITERGRGDRIDFSDLTGAHAGSVILERGRGVVVSSVTATGPGGAELGEALLFTEVGVTLCVGTEAVGHLRQRSAWWRWMLAFELGRFTIQDSDGVVVGHVTRTDRGRGGWRACNVIAYEQEASPAVRDLAPAINEAVNETLDLPAWARISGRFSERLIAWSDALEQ